ncbi:hypothetical protein, partial [Kallipyga massiliensis]|uniref:hypothetical protein n=1 Tax=Kallipyga massiliensis TaxID=1472764 RepID=UPI001C54E093
CGFDRICGPIHEKSNPVSHLIKEERPMVILVTIGFSFSLCSSFVIDFFLKAKRFTLQDFSFMIN